MIKDRQQHRHDRLRCRYTAGDFKGVSADATAGRLQNACQSLADSIAWCTFCVQQSAAEPAVTTIAQSCLALPDMIAVNLTRYVELAENQID